MLRKTTTARPAGGYRNPILAAALAVGLVVAARAALLSPIDTVRAFCREDGRGTRLGPGSWNVIAPLVAWELEPAWDRIVLVDGYRIGAARQKGNMVLIPVTWTVVGEVSPRGHVRQRRDETRIFRLVPTAAGGWRLAPPPPPPHVFANLVDPERLYAMLSGEQPGYRSAADFVSSHLRSGGSAHVVFSSVRDIARASGLVETDKPRAGAVVIFEDAGLAYHAAVVVEDGWIVSATLNRGVVRSVPDAFAGRRRYFMPRPERPTAATTKHPPPTPAGGSSRVHATGA